MEKTGLKPTDLDDAALVEMALGDNSQLAYFTLYARYHTSVCAHISRFVSSQEEIEDICMESFEKAFGQLATFKKGSKFSTWIFTIARNTAFDHKSKDKVRGKNMEVTKIDAAVAESVNVPDNTMSPEEEIIESQDHENFLSCIEGLPDLYRDVAKMCFIDNLGYKEIAEKAGMPINTVKTRISRAKGIIIRMMTEME